MPGLSTISRPQSASRSRTLSLARLVVRPLLRRSSFALRTVLHLMVALLRLLRSVCFHYALHRQ